MIGQGQWPTTAPSWINDDNSTSVGMNRPDAVQNPHLLLDVAHWRSGVVG